MAGALPSIDVSDLEQNLVAQDQVGEQVEQTLQRDARRRHRGQLR